VLLVEDEALLRHILGESLEDAGYRVTLAPDGDAAWSMIIGGLAFDVLITDIRMPGSIDGLDLARHVIANHQSARVIVMSGFSPGPVDLGKDAVFLSKPFTPARLVEMI
jgi:CheY-like chemotaxis protein